MILALFDPPSDFARRIREVVPDEQVVLTEPGDDAYDDALRKADVIVGRPVVEDLDRAGALSWLQLSSAGADAYVDVLRDEVVLTAANGVYGVPTSEHAVAMMLAMVRGIPDAVRAAGEKRWQRPLQYDELYGRTCGILGLGDIGSSIARRADAFGMRVVALRRRPGNPPDYVDAVYGPDGLYELLQESDHVVNVLPATEATHHLIDAAALAGMKPSAYFYNVGRGTTVDEGALVDALKEGRLAGAGLDVFEEEPLPPESPLWDLPNVVLTPHRGGSSPREEERVADLFLQNLERRANGEDLLNVVDRGLGY
ncbi:MAG: D-2-hydroxyacid dehydrogenase [Rhodothermales bacterium]